MTDKHTSIFLLLNRTKIPQIASCPSHCPAFSINYRYTEAPATGCFQGFRV